MSRVARYAWFGGDLKPVTVRADRRLFGAAPARPVRARFVPPPGVMRAPVPGELPVYDYVTWLLGDPVTGRRPSVDQALDGILVTAGVPR